MNCLIIRRKADRILEDIFYINMSLVRSLFVVHIVCGTYNKHEGMAYAEGFKKGAILNEKLVDDIKGALSG